jgi:hypothetical protein
MAVKPPGPEETSKLRKDVLGLLYDVNDDNSKKTGLTYDPLSSKPARARLNLAEDVADAFGTDGAHLDFEMLDQFREGLKKLKLHPDVINYIMDAIEYDYDLRPGKPKDLENLLELIVEGLDAPKFLTDKERFPIRHDAKRLEGQIVKYIAAQFS